MITRGINTQGIIALFFLLFTLSCFQNKEESESHEITINSGNTVLLPPYAVSKSYDSLYLKATWYLYFLNAVGHSSSHVNFVDKNGETIKTDVPIVTVLLRLRDVVVKEDTSIYTYSLREYMNPAGSYNSLFYKITFVDGILYSAKSDDNFVADLREGLPEIDSFFRKELIKNESELSNFLKEEIDRRGIVF